MSTGDEPHVNDDDVEKEGSEVLLVVDEAAWTSWCDEVRKVIALVPVIPALNVQAIEASLNTILYWMEKKEVVP